MAASTTGLFLGLISDIAVTADGTRLLVTGSQVTEFRTSTMAWDGVEYSPVQFSYAVATSPGLGGIMAEGLSVDRGSPDLVVNPLGQDNPLFSTELDDSGVDWIAPHTLALSNDGSYLFAVNPVPYFGTSQTFYAIHFTPVGGTTAPVGSVGLFGVGTLAGLGLFLAQFRRRRRRAA